MYNPYKEHCSKLVSVCDIIWNRVTKICAYIHIGMPLVTYNWFESSNSAHVYTSCAFGLYIGRSCNLYWQNVLFVQYMNSLKFRWISWLIIALLLFVIFNMSEYCPVYLSMRSCICVANKLMFSMCLGYLCLIYLYFCNSFGVAGERRTHVKTYLSTMFDPDHKTHLCNLGVLKLVNWWSDNNISGCTQSYSQYHCNYIWRDPDCASGHWSHVMRCYSNSKIDGNLCNWWDSVQNGHHPMHSMPYAYCYPLVEYDNAFLLNLGQDNLDMFWNTE